MTNIDKKTSDILNRALDDAMESFERDHTVIYGPETVKLKTYFDFVARADRSWKKSKQCAFQGCTNESIVRSHTIQKSGPLALFAENGHLLQPSLIQNDGMIMKLIGLQNASVFPGFCEEHEELFARFERTKTLQTPSDIALQCFRMVCRELVRLQHESNHFKLILDEYIQFRNNYIKAKLLEAKADLKISAITLTGDAVETTFIERIKSHTALIANVSSGIYKDLNAAIRSGDGELALFHIDIPDILPVCLSGLGTLQMTEEKPGLLEATLFLGVLPSPKGTEVIVATDHGNKKLLEYYVYNCLDSRFALLSAIESWMIYQTDHWFIKPSEWNILPMQKRETLLRLMRDDHTTLGHECPLSVFDSTRKKMLNIFETSQEYINNGERAVEVQRNSPPGSKRIPQLGPN
ncbi:MAG: hypothetical protein HZB33_11245 [Nitrospirae bacterium]|nr:hypothetical protein [Nitrospirota bacterium]